MPRRNRPWKTRRQKRRAWSALKDKIVVRLQRVEFESPSYESDRTDEGLNREKTRVESLANTEEIAVRNMVIDSRSAGYPKAAALDALVTQFFTNWRSYVFEGWQPRLSSVSLGRAGKNDQDASFQSLNSALDALNKIRQL